MNKETKDIFIKINQENGGNRLIFPSRLERFLKSQGNDVSDVELSNGAISFIRFTFQYTEYNPILEQLIEKITNSGRNTNINGRSVRQNNKEYDLSMNPKIVQKDLGVKEIILPIMPISDTLNGNVRGREGLGLVSGEAIAGTLKNIVDEVKSGSVIGITGSIGSAFIKSSKYTMNKAYRAGMGLMEKFSVESIALKQAFGGGGVDNPHEQLLFDGHDRRSFSLSYDFLKPETKEEEQILVYILEVFRVCSLGSYENYVITPPPTVNVEFISLPEYSNFITYKKCYVTTNVVFGGSGKIGFESMESGFPFAKLTMNFAESEFITQKDAKISKNSGIRFE